VGFCEHGNEPSGTINGGEFLDQLSDYELLFPNGRSFPTNFLKDVSTFISWQANKTWRL
jgi:hypothetical protein